MRRDTTALGRAAAALFGALLLAACGPAGAPATQPGGSAVPAPAVASTASRAESRPVASAAPAAVEAATNAAPVVRVPPPPASLPAALDKVTYGIVSANPMHWVALVAQAKNLMEPYGIDFDLVQTRTTPAAMSALAGGSVDLATTSPGGSWDVQQKAPGFKQVMEIVSTNPYTVLVQPEIAEY